MNKKYIDYEEFLELYPSFKQISSDYIKRKKKPSWLIKHSYKIYLVDIDEFHKSIKIKNKEKRSK